METNGINVFTLADTARLSRDSQTDPIKRVQFDEAVKGNYVYSDQQAREHTARTASGSHAGDNGSGEQYLGLAAGKLPGHPTFSTESPYNIDGFRSAQGGQWSGSDDDWTYSPSQSQIDRDPMYLDKLQKYYSREKGNGIDRIEMPQGLAATAGTEPRPSTGLLEQLLNKVKQKEVPLRLDGGMLGIRG